MISRPTSVNGQRSPFSISRLKVRKMLQVLEALQEAVKIQCTCMDVEPYKQHVGSASPASVLILFSGGVDSALIAALAHRALPPE